MTFEIEIQYITYNIFLSHSKQNSPKDFLEGLGENSPTLTLSLVHKKKCKFNIFYIFNSSSGSVFPTEVHQWIFPLINVH